MADSDGKAQRLATAHGLGNATVLGLFVLSWVSRKVGLRSFGRFLATVGMGLGSLTAHLGGHLSFIRGIGVNQTAFEKPRNRWTAVLDEAALPEGKPTRANADGVDLVLYRRGERMYALSGRCSHRGGPLYRGTVDESRACPSIVCPWHSSIFCLEDGSILQGPASAEQPSFEVRIADGKVEVRPRAS
jgi:nitrite reductase/ring-hydroxylating ferredoxin subunit